MRPLELSPSFLIALLVLLAFASPVSSQTAAPVLINYQGELRSPTRGEPVPDGSYDMVFKIYDVQSAGTALWEWTHSTGNGNPVQVADGIFSVILGSGTGNALDASLFGDADRWLEIVVGAETLSPRQRITSVAYSLVSENSRLLSGREASQFANSTHAHSGSEITSGTVSEPWIDPLITRDTEKDAAITAHTAIADAHHSRYTDAEAVAAMGAKGDSNPLNHDKTTTLPWASITSLPAGFADGIDNDSGGDITGVTAGAGLTGGGDSGAVTLSAAFGGTGASPTVARSDHNHTATYWALTGNAGATPGTNFLGTTDNNALELKVNNARALKLEPNATSPNIVGGFSGNTVTGGIYGATISGGGTNGYINQVTNNYGTVGGGHLNTASGEMATVGGGSGNVAQGSSATVAGGTNNTAIVN